MDRGIVVSAIQVCLELNSDNLQHETTGLFEAMKTFKLNEGTIVTLAQKDQFMQDKMVVKVVPFHESIEKNP